MSEITEAVYAFLEQSGIAYRRMRHDPTGSMAECTAVDGVLGALTPKNLFLTTKNGKRFYLCLARPDVRFCTSQVSRQAGSSRLSFAPEAALLEKLRCRAGSASPMGLIFPEARGVGLIVDSGLPACETLGFHPCDNTETLAMAAGDFFGVFLPAVGVSPVFVDMPAGEA